MDVVSETGRKRIFISGGLGFIGVNFVNYVQKKSLDWDVVVYDNQSIGQLEDLAGVIGRRYHFVNREEQVARNVRNSCTVVSGDLADFKRVREAMETCEMVVHLAAECDVRKSMEDPRRFVSVNVGGTVNVLEGARLNNIAKVVIASSSAAVGEQHGLTDERALPRPISFYGVSKLTGEALGMVYSRAFGIDVASLRFSNVYGPFSKRKTSVIARFFKAILRDEPLVIYGDGNQTRDFVHVDDVSQGIVLALSTPGIGGEIFHLGSGTETSINNVLEELRRVLRLEFKVRYEPERPGEIRRSSPDISKAKRMLGYESKVSLTSGLEDAWEWFKENIR